MRLFTFFTVWAILLAVAFAGGYLALHHSRQAIESAVEATVKDHVQGPWRPRPRPNPEPPPAPLEESDAKLFQRLRLHIEQSADERAARKIEAAFDEAVHKMDLFNPDGPVTDEPSQFIFTSLFASSIVALVWKAVKFILMAILVSALLGLLYAYWAWIAGGFVVATTIVCWPISFAAAKLAQPKEKA